MWVCFFITILTFWVLKLTHKKTGPVWLNRRVKRFSNPNTYYMTSNVAEWFWVWCHLNSISTVFEATFSYYSIMAFLQNFLDFRVFVFGYRSQNEKPEITENLYFWVYKVQMHMDLFFDNYFNFLGVKTKINKNLLNLINLDGLEALKRQTPGTRLEIWLNNFEFDVIWRAS